MFYGPPGTGKTSLANVLANELKRSIYIMSFDISLSDGEFYKAIKNIHNTKSILLLEDIDCVFKDRNTGGAHISFSALLNVLDGVNYNETMITILTTNYIDLLDKALTRPGRIDIIIKFDIITINQLNNLIELYNLKIHNDTLERMDIICKNNKLTAATITSFLFFNRHKQYTDKELINYFKLYIKEHINFVDENNPLCV